MKYAILLQTSHSAVVEVEAPSLREAISMADENPEEYLDKHAIDEETDDGQWCVAKPRYYSPYVDDVKDIINYQRDLGYGFEIKK